MSCTWCDEYTVALLGSLPFFLQINGLVSHVLGITDEKRGMSKRRRSPIKGERVSYGDTRSNSVLFSELETDASVFVALSMSACLLAY